MNERRKWNMNMGKTIRENRLRRNMTQERLAQKLNVTAQAVSRWESGQGCPDIALLPELSAVFGVTIDELFERSQEQHLDRIEAMGGGLWDWCCTNHTRAIDYYKRFTKAHPGYAPGFMWLMDSLIKDGRLDEAREALTGMRAVLGEDYHTPMYEGWIALAAGEREEADRIWDGMVKTYPENWFAWSTRADAYAKQARYDEAIACYREAIAHQTPPRYTDNEDSIARICEIRGDAAGAIEAYEHVVRILREDWGITEGETVEGYLQNIARLKEENRKES